MWKGMTFEEPFLADRVKDNLYCPRCRKECVPVGARNSTNGRHRYPEDMAPCYLLKKIVEGGRP